jgi:hypothetical protein
MSGVILVQGDNNERLHQTLGRTDRPDLVFTMTGIRRGQESFTRDRRVDQKDGAES